MISNHPISSASFGGDKDEAINRIVEELIKEVFQLKLLCL